MIPRLSGLALRLDVGSNENLRTFILPRALLAQHSLYLCICSFIPEQSIESTKKRKRSQVSDEEDLTENTAKTDGAEVVIKAESDTGGNETKDKKERLRAHIQLPDVDPAIFGLFLHYIYKDAYPRNVDAVMVSVPHQQYSRPPTASNSVPQVPRQHPSVSLPVRAEPVRHPGVSAGSPSTANISSTSTAAQHGSEASTSTFNREAAYEPTLHPLAPKHSPKPSTFPPLTPNSTPPPPSTPAPSNRQPVNTNPLMSTLPASIKAHFLGYRLGACAFINYTMTRIHCAIGTSIRLTPGLIYTIWSCTQSAPQVPLRRLILDYLVTYWSHPEPLVRAAYIHPDERGWDMIFDSCKDVRSYLIRGMQNGVKVSVPEAYHITKKMMVESNWEQLGRGQEGGASAGPDPGAEAAQGA